MTSDTKCRHLNKEGADTGKQGWSFQLSHLTTSVVENLQQMRMSHSQNELDEK
ncbi:hypothetical protein [Chroococcidiopsis sp. CCMEE 29]|jgi:hypothetical protein|uniref:hypothetical protein n=1 Tax=Chroococcidiopsis sp. CCMEE 29 TaxID=155894 RepID=UPI002020F47E|nr:hypothetical protein [Chroococcidiopsis sp. CCMEE 29]